MLRISVNDDEGSLLIVLEGRLMGPWVGELRTICGERAAADGYRQVTVDLCGLTAMDDGGQALLQELLWGGALLRCSDVLNQYLVEQMSASDGAAQEACVPCRSFPEKSESSAERAGPTVVSSRSSDAA